MQDIDRMWAEYYPKVFGYFYRRLRVRQDVELLTELTLTQFLETYSDPEKISKISHLNNYLWKIAHNQLINFERRKSLEVYTVKLDEDFENVDLELEKSRSLNFQDTQEKIRKWLEKNFKGADYQILLQTLVEDKNSQEIAHNLHLSNSEIRQRLAKAVNKFPLRLYNLWHS